MDHRSAERKTRGAAIIAGFGEGLGEETAIKLAQEGLKVGIVSRTPEKLEQIARRHEGALFPVPADVTDPTSIDGAVQHVDSTLGPIKCAVFNAGAFLKGSILDFPPHEFERAWRVGAYGGFVFGQAVAKRMVTRNAGTILFSGATASLRGNAKSYGFSAPKFALRSIAQSMARELGPQGIHVAHIVIDGAINGPKHPNSDTEKLIYARDLAEVYLQLYKQPRSTWTQELDIRPWCEPF